MSAQQKLAICRSCDECPVDRCKQTNRLVAVMAAKDNHCPLGKWPGDPRPERKAESRKRTDPRSPIPGPSKPICDVVIPCHNYGRYLRECVESVRASTVGAEIIVVDDSSTDDTREVAESLGVQYVRVEARSAIRARQAGFELGSLPFVLFLDADDMVDPEYIRTGIEQLRDPSVGIVYSDFDCFGDRSGHRVLNYDRDSLAWRNSIHAGSVFRRAALEISRAMELETSDISHDDWAVARRVIRDGWQVAKNPTSYRYRQHSDSMMHNRVACATPFYDTANLAHEPITLFIPIAGRPHAMRAMFAFLDRQTRDRSTIKLILGDGSGSEAVEGRIRDWLATCDYPDARYLRLDVGQRPGLADEDRKTNGQSRADVRIVMARIYTRLRAELTTEYVWILEDDVIPPNDCCDRLLRSMEPGVAAVGAPYRSRYHSGFVARRANDVPIQRPAICLEQIESTGFGCAVLRSAFLKSAPLTHVGKYADYDLNFYHWLRTQKQRLLLDWTCEAEHLGPNT